MKKSLFVALAAAAALSACGGDDFVNPPPATTQVPASASASATGFIAYLKLLVASTGTDVLEPVDTSMVTGPTDDTSEPTVVD